MSYAVCRQNESAINPLYHRGEKKNTEHSCGKPFRIACHSHIWLIDEYCMRINRTESLAAFRSIGCIFISYGRVEQFQCTYSCVQPNGFMFLYYAFPDVGAIEVSADIGFDTVVFHCFLHVLFPRLSE